MSTLHAYFSNIAVAVGSPAYVYRRENGETVVITAFYASKAIGDDLYKFPDKVYRGRVLDNENNGFVQLLEKGSPDIK